jgi:2-acylglycerol O-acyltransferase 2
MQRGWIHIKCCKLLLLSLKLNLTFLNPFQVVIAVGGAQEALNARPGIYKLVLKNRKGFVRLAIETGASIVPVFSFNEVEVFDQPSNDPGTPLRIFQDTFKRFTGVAPAFFFGRGFFQYSFGLIPRRHQITTVVGAPIETNQCHTPTDEEVDKVHGKFIEALVKLFEDHKREYLKNADKMQIEIE